MLVFTDILVYSFMCMSIPVVVIGIIVVGTFIRSSDTITREGALRVWEYRQQRGNNMYRKHGDNKAHGVERQRERERART